MMFAAGSGSSDESEANYSEVGMHQMDTFGKRVIRDSDEEEPDNEKKARIRVPEAEDEPQSVAAGAPREKATVKAKQRRRNTGKQGKAIKLTPDEEKLATEIKEAYIMFSSSPHQDGIKADIIDYGQNYPGPDEGKWPYWPRKEDA